MKLHIGSGRLQGELDPLQWQDQASIEWLRSDRVSKSTRRARGGRDEEGEGSRGGGKPHGRRQHRETPMGEHHGRR